MLRNPHLLVFDEATSSLDSLTEEEISRTMRDVAAHENVVTVLIAHRLSTVLHADRIFVLEKGRVIEEGQHDELLARKGLYYAMWRQQVGERRTISPSMAGAPPFAGWGLPWPGRKRHVRVTLRLLSSKLGNARCGELNRAHGDLRNASTHLRMNGTSQSAVPGFDADVCLVNQVTEKQCVSRRARLARASPC